jgi:putative addiction module component (TIGR02574 family)
MNATYMDEILTWSREDRLRLVQEVLESIAADDEPPALTPRQASEVDRRIAAHRADPSRAIPWEDAIARLRERHG